MRGFMLLFSVLFAVGSFADPFVREGTRENVEDSLGVIVRSDGALYKVGSDSVTRSMDTLAGGNIAVEAFGGSVTLTPGGTRGQTVPTAVLSKAAFWVDATTNVVVDANGKVTEWLDVREKGGNGTYNMTRAVAMTTLTNQLPSFVATGAGKSGELPSVSFGRLASGQWMQWTAPDDSKQELTNIRHLFVVHGVFESYGQVIGHDASVLSFIVGNLALAKSALFYLNSTYAAPMRGRTFLDRLRVDPGSTVPKDGWQLLETEIDVGGATASNFFNDRNLLQKTPFGTCWAGGDNLCEVIVFTAPLTEDERQQVSDYLWTKWRSDASDLPVSVAGYNGATVRVEIPGGVTNQLVAAAGDGWAKAGGGVVRESEVTPETRSGHAATRLEGGSLLPAYLPHDIIPQTNVTLHARDDGDAVITASAHAADGAFVKSGAGTVLVTRFPTNVENICVSEGTLRLAPPENETVAPNTPVAVLSNGNFEASVPNWSDGVRHVYEDGETADGWTSGGHYLVQVMTHGRQMWDMPSAPQGQSFVSLQKTFTLSTTVGIPVDGIYSVSFLLAQCKKYGWHQMQLILDETNVVAHVIANTDHYRFLRYRLPWLAAGDHTLTFHGLNTADKRSGIDDIRVEWITSEPEIEAIPNPNFEISGTTTANTIRDSASTHWNFTNGAGIAMRGSLYCQDPADGDRVLYVAYAGAASTTMTFTEPGRYRLIGHVARACPSSNDYKPAYGSTAQTSICIDGNVIGTQAMTLESKMRERVLGTFDVTADNLTPTLTITNLNVSITTMMVFDRLRVIRLNDEIVQNGGFEEGDDESNYKTRRATHWETTRTIPSYSSYAYTVPVRYADLPNSFGTAQFEGSYRLRIQGNGSARQIVTLPTVGCYRFVAHVSSRWISTRGYGLGRNPIEVTLSRNGTVYPLGVLYSWEDCFRRYSIPFAVEEPGEYELAMTGKLSGDVTTFLDGVSIEPVRKTVCEGLSKDTRIEVAEGAKLSLDYLGTIPVGEVRLGDRSVSGVIQASKYPQFLSGAGTLYCVPKGTMLMLR